jgi:RimJ/RimL family protein N-acetyltransferase
MFKYANNKIETERLILRRFCKEDAAKVAKICNTEKVYRGTLALPHPYTLECAIGWIERQDDNFTNDYYYDYAITDKITGELYGCMGMGLNIKDQNGELGYWIGEDYEGNGYATEASKAMIQFAFEIKKLHRVHARHFGSNPASGRVIQKCGMLYEGTFKEHIYKINRFEDIVQYGILKE